jgi:uncharacterized membrane protein YgcG
MKKNFLLYAVLVTMFSTVASWTSLVGASTRGSGGSSWTSHSRGGYSGGFSGGGGHK